MLRYLRGKEKPESDADLLARFQGEEDKEALASLFNRYLALSYGLAIRYLKTEDRAEDAVMAIYIELQEKLPQHQVRNFKNWLHTFVRNHCLMQLRREKREITENIDPLIVQSAEIWHPLDEEMPDQDREIALRACLDQLNEQQIACVQLFYFEGHSYLTIAEFRQESVGQVRSNIQNGRRNLRKCIEERENRNTSGE